MYRILNPGNVSLQNFKLLRVRKCISKEYHLVLTTRPISNYDLISRINCVKGERNPCWTVLYWNSLLKVIVTLLLVSFSAIIGVMFTHAVCITNSYRSKVLILIWTSITDIGLNSCSIRCSSTTTNPDSIKQTKRKPRSSNYAKYIELLQGKFFPVRYFIDDEYNSVNLT